MANGIYSPLIPPFLWMFFLCLSNFYHFSVSTFLKILKALRLEMQVKRFELFREVFIIGNFLFFFFVCVCVCVCVFFCCISTIFTIFFISASFRCRAAVSQRAIHPAGCSRFGGTHSGPNGRLSFGAMVCGANSMFFGNKVLSHLSLEFVSVVLVLHRDFVVLLDLHLQRPKCGVNSDCII